MVPPALGVDYRILNGYVYLTPVPVADPDDIPARVPHFLERAGFYYANWNDLYAKWIDKARDVIARIEAIEFAPLPDMVDARGRHQRTGQEQPLRPHARLPRADRHRRSSSGSTTSSS